jgi:hypothetical protein
VLNSEQRQPVQGVSLRMNGAQVKEFALCSLEILRPLMQGHTSLPSWKSWLVMRTIVQLIDQKLMGVKDVEHLDMAIRAHAMLYKAAWPSRLRPKLHFLAHIPLEVLLCGPASHYWCFAFERKNMDVKRAVEASNYKDAAGSAMETLSVRQAFAIKFAKKQTMLDEEDSYPAI